MPPSWKVACGGAAVLVLLLLLLQSRQLPHDRCDVQAALHSEREVDLSNCNATWLALPEVDDRTLPSSSSASSSSSLSSAGGNVETMPWVTSLNLAGNQLEELPRGLLALPSLTSLLCLGNRIEIAPQWLGQLSQITMLSFKSNRLTQVEDWAVPPSVAWLILTDNRCVVMMKMMIG